MTISDEKLIAFMDGALDNSEMDQVADAIADDPKLAAKLEALQAGDTALKDMFASLDEKPIRADTLALLEDAATETTTEATAEPADDNVVAFKPKSRAAEPVSQAWVWRQQAMAASLALVFGFSGGAFVFYGGEDIEEEEEEFGAVYQTASYINAHDPLSAALETGASATVHQISDSKAELLTSFRVQSGAYCREYSLQMSEQMSRNIACKDDQGWRVVASVAVSAPNTDAGQYVTASSEASAALDAMIMGMIDGDILGTAREAEAIRGGWK